MMKMKTARLNPLFALVLALGLASTAPAQPIYNKVLTAVRLDAVGDSVMVAGSSFGTVGFQITGTWVGTVQFSTSINGTDWVEVSGYNATSRTAASEATDNGIYYLGIAGTRYVKARMSAWTSGAAVVTTIATDDIAVLTSGGSSGGGGGAEGSVDVLSFPNNEPFNAAQWGGSAVTGGAGAVAAGTPRVTLASDDPAVTALQALDNAIAGSEIQADIVAPLPTGSNTVGAVNLAQYTPASGRLPVDGSGVTQPISAASLPLPSGAATAANQSTGNTSLGTIAGAVRTDDAAFTPGSGSAVPLAGFADETTPDVVDEGDAGAVRMTLYRGLHVNMRDAAGAEYNSGNPFVVADFGQRTSLTTIAGSIKNEDAAHTSTDAGVPAWGVRSDADASLASASGDYAPFQFDALGYLKVNVKAATGFGGTSATDDAAFTPGSGSATPIAGFADETSPDLVDEGDVGAVRMTLRRALHVNLRDASGNELAVGAQYAEDAAHADGNQVMMAGAVRRDSPVSSTATDGDNATLNTDADGRLYTNNKGTGATGAAVPAAAQYMGAVSSGNLTGIIQADASAIINMSTATTTQVVALTSAQKIYITSWDVIAAGTGTLKLVYGTGTNCGTGTTDLTPAYSLVAQSGIAKGSGLGPVLVVPAGNALCVTTSAAVGMQGTVAYTKF